MDQIVILSSLLNLGYAAAALALCWAVLTGLDRLNHAPFTKVQEVINADPRAAALYRGLRFLGVALLVGQLLA